MEGYFNKEQRVKIDVKSFYLSQRSGITHLSTIYPWIQQLDVFSHKLVKMWHL